MADHKDNKETAPKKENEVIDGVLELAWNMLDSAEFIAPKVRQETLALANQVRGSIETLQDMKPKSTEVDYRKARLTDYTKPGEHTGVWLKASYPNGDSLEINIYGGLRDPKDQKEYQDTTNRYGSNQGHHDRTEDLASSSTQINIQYKKGSDTLSELWIVDQPGQRPSIALTSLRKMRSPGNHDTSKETVVFRQSNPPYYEQFHDLAMDIKNKSTSLLI